MWFPLRAEVFSEFWANGIYAETAVSGTHSNGVNEPVVLECSLVRILPMSSASYRNEC